MTLDNLLKQIGTTVTYSAPEALGAAACRYFALAVGDPCARYDASKCAEVVAPPTLVCETNSYMRGPMNSNGYIGHLWDLEVEGMRLIRGGNTYEFFVRVKPSDVITATWTLESVEEKQSSAGKQMFVFTSLAAYSNQDEQALATNRETIILVQR